MAIYRYLLFFASTVMTKAETYLVKIKNSYYLNKTNKAFIVYLQSVRRLYSLFTAYWKAVSRTYGQLKVPFGRQPRRHLGRDFLYIFFMFYNSIKAITEVIYKWFYFQVLPVYNYSTWCTKRVFTYLVHQPLICKVMIN